MHEPLFTADEMRAAEEAYPGYPGTVPELMERAGRAVAEEAMRAFPEARAFTVVCGGGSNGGDGRVAARALAEAGRTPRVVEAKPEDEAKDLGRPDVIVDALFGTGFSGAPREGAARLIAQVNGAGAPVVAVDLPSGVDASTGEVAGAAVEAALSVTFHGRKVGHAVAPGRFLCGEVVVADIGLAGGEHTAVRRVLPEILAAVPRRGPRDTKYRAGHVLVVGGSRGLTGAACLAAEAAFRADAGYVTVAVPASSLPVVEQRLLEAVKRPLPEDVDGVVAEEAVETVLELARNASAVALGPGLGRSAGARRLVARLLGELELPVVVDADALFGLEPGADWPPAVLTPHAGELARLLGTTAPEVDAHRLGSVRAAAARFGCTCLLKGADTIVAVPDGEALVSDLGIPALATAGTGDVLTGIVAAFLAKGLPPALAAAAGAAAHGLAARTVPHHAGLVASDVAAALPNVL